MKSADSLHTDILKRLRDIESIIANGIFTFYKNKYNKERFRYRGGYYNLIELKAELDSYNAERNKLLDLKAFYEETLPIN